MNLLALLAPAWLRPLLGLLLLGLLVSGCSTAPLLNPARPALMPELRRTLEAPAPAPRAAPSTPARSDDGAAVAGARDTLATLPTGKAPRRFSVVLNNATPELVFMSLLSETPLSVAVDPAVKGPTSVSLKDVTLREALDLLRELHHLEYKVIGRHIVVSPAQLQARLFKVNYPSFHRSGRSDLRVLSGSITGGAAAASGSAAGNGHGGNGGSGGNGGNTSAAGSAPESSRITTAQRNDLWQEIEATVKLLVGDKDGRSVVVSPQTGTLMVRALPREIRAVQEYLDATRLAVERQVMLEAKVVEVQLRDSERAGINWAAFKAGLSTRATGGVVAPGGVIGPNGAVAGGLLNVTPGAALESAASAAGSLLGLAFQTSNFAAVLEFLGTQGHTQVLSSPRIATMNNQKAVLKVGTDDYFVTSISTTTTPVGNTTSTTPTIGVTPFFSGISLDVTPSIDEGGSITLHVHPAVSSVTERNKVLNLGTLGTYSLPLASSDINESDAVVRAQDGHIIAIGGLMRQSSASSDSGIPGAEGSIFHKLLGGQRSRLSEKRELVILLKPTIVDPGKDDADGRQDALQRLLDWTETQPLQPQRPPPSPTAAPAPAAPTPASADAGRANLRSVMTPPRRWIAHLDMDAFYASVELLRYPELAGLPVVIGGGRRMQPQPGPDGRLRFGTLADYAGRGVITTATYPARALGVHSGMGLMKAAALAPQAVLLPVDFDEYRRYSRLFKAAVAEVAPVIEDRGIDEIYIDLSAVPGAQDVVGHDASGGVRAIAQEIRNNVRRCTGLSCSIGVTPNKLLSKIASELDKPDGLTVLTEADIAGRIWPLPVRRIKGIGPKAGARLAALGITTIGELAARPRDWLVQHFGRSYGRWLHDAARGIDDRPVVTHSEPVSMSRETTFDRNLHAVADRAELGSILTGLCEQLAGDLRRKGYGGRTIGVKLRFDDFRTVTRDLTLAAPTADAAMIRRAAAHCLRRVDLRPRLRLLGVRVAGLTRGNTARPAAAKGRPMSRARAACMAAAAPSLFEDEGQA